MEKAYKYRIYPTKYQKELIQKTFGCVRFIYNHFLYDQMEMYQTDKSHMSFYDMCKVLTGLTRRRNSEKQLYFSIADEIPTNDVNPYKCPKSGVLKLGSKGVAVKWLQWELNEHGAKLTVDGFFGKKTETALINYQRKAKLKIDGMAGAETRKSLNAN